jgi:hypothetical protein
VAALDPLRYWRFQPHRLQPLPAEGGSLEAPVKALTKECVLGGAYPGRMT